MKEKFTLSILQNGEWVEIGQLKCDDEFELDIKNNNPKPTNSTNPKELSFSKSFKTIRYSWIGAYEHKIKFSPIEDLLQMGLDVIWIRHEPIGDCSFAGIDKLPDPMPDYIQLSNYKPM